MSKPFSQAVVGDIIEFVDVDWDNVRVGGIETLSSGDPPRTVTVRFTSVDARKKLYFAEVISIADEEAL